MQRDRTPTRGAAWSRHPPAHQHARTLARPSLPARPPRPPLKTLASNSRKWEGIYSHPPSILIASGTLGRRTRAFSHREYVILDPQNSEYGLCARVNRALSMTYRITSYFKFAVCMLVVAHGGNGTSPWKPADAAKNLRPTAMAAGAARTPPLRVDTIVVDTTTLLGGGTHTIAIFPCCLLGPGASAVARLRCLRSALLHSRHCGRAAGVAVLRATWQCQ